MRAEAGFVLEVGGGLDVHAEGAALNDVEEVALVALGDDLRISLASAPIFLPSSSPSSLSSNVMQGSGAYLNIPNRHNLLHQRPNNNTHLLLLQPLKQRMLSNALPQPIQLLSSLSMVWWIPFIAPGIGRVHRFRRNGCATSHAVAAWKSFGGGGAEGGWWAAGEAGGIIGAVKLGGLVAEVWVRWGGECVVLVFLDDLLNGVCT